MNVLCNNIFNFLTLSYLQPNEARAKSIRYPTLVLRRRTESLEYLVFSYGETLRKQALSRP